MTPDDRKYAKTHEWIKIEDDLAVIGISDHAQSSLGDITFIELPPVDDAHLAAGDECCVIESVKAASDIYAPVAGIIAEVNEVLQDRPEIVNDDCYGDGWIFKLRDFDAAAIHALLSAADYESSVGTAG
jgi:glycine cleavage system H protein